jgi:hypothetical protein
VLAYPRRRDSFHKISEDLVDALDGAEIWNRKVDGLSPVDIYFRLAKDRGLALIVAMDLHTWPQIFPMWDETPVGPDPLDGNTVAAAITPIIALPLATRFWR